MSRHGPKRRFRHSIFFRLLLIMIVAGVLINALVGSGFRQIFKSNGIRELGKTNAALYLQYIADDLGPNPTATKIAAFSEKSGFDIRLETLSGEALFGDDFPSTRELQPHIHRRADIAFKVGKTGDRYFLIYPREKDRIVYFSPQSLRFEVDETFITLILLGLTAVLLLAFAGIRHQLRPLKQIREALEKVDEGSLDVNLPIKGKDEFSEVKASFNAMLMRLKESAALRTQLLLDVSHELRSPLTRTKVALEFLPDSKAKHSVSTDIDEMELITRTILDSSRLESGSAIVKPQAGSLKAIVQKALPQTEGLSVDYQSDVTAWFDPDWTTLVIKNVVSNARKYSAENKPIAIVVTGDSDAGTIKVVDQGMGIPEEELSRLFEPFYQVDKARTASPQNAPSFGFGLYLCKKVMELQKGSIAITSEVGKGTTVTLVFAPSKG